MSTYTQILYQIVFGTLKRKRTLTSKNRPILLKYISGILKANKCHLYRINAVEDHIHILVGLHPTVSLASLVKDIKVATALLISGEQLFPSFEGWQSGYSAFTYSIEALDNLIEYVKSQEDHHKRISFIDEYKAMLRECKIEFDPKYVP